MNKENSFHIIGRFESVFMEKSYVREKSEASLAAGPRNQGANQKISLLQRLVLVLQ